MSTDSNTPDAPPPVPPPAPEPDPEPVADLGAPALDADTIRRQQPATLEDLRLLCMEAMKISLGTAITLREQAAVYEARFDGLAERITLLEDAVDDASSLIGTPMRGQPEPT